MICKNCANIFDDSFSCCPECGTPIKSNYDVQEKTVEEAEYEAVKENRETSVEGSEADSQANSENSAETEIIYKAEDIFSENVKREEEEISPEEANVNQDDEPLSEADSHEEEDEIIPERSEKKPPSRKEKSAMNVIVALTVAVFILLGVLTALGAFTDIFEESDDTVKTIALSGLSSEETKQLEDYLSDIGIVAYEDFEQGEDTEGSFVARYLNPGNPGSLYSKKYGIGKLTVNEADPACRFANENGDYSYFVADESLVKVILKEFGFTVSGQINEKDCYYYNGKYYFANSGETFSSSVKAQVLSTIRSSDGTYYAKCAFYDESSADGNSEYFETCVVFDKVTISGVTEWEIVEISHDTYIDANGVIIPNNKGDLSYDMKKETVENKDESGKVIASVSFEYPCFSGNTTAEKSVNQLYENIIESYKASPELIKENVTVTSRVTYNKNGCLSIVQETVTGNARMETAENENGEETQVLILPEKEIDGYILDVNTGDNLSKRNIFTADYNDVQVALYCIYSGYDMTSENIPADREEIGKAVYSSSNAMCEDGYTFFFEKDGYIQRVVIPYSAENFFAQNYQ